MLGVIKPTTDKEISDIISDLNIRKSAGPNSISKNSNKNSFSLPVEMGSLVLCFQISKNDFEVPF